MPINKTDVEHYLEEVKDAIWRGSYRIEMNSRRADNLKLFTDYVIDESKAKEILLSLDVTDFSEVLQNDHAGYEHEQLYVFGKDVLLTERFGTERVNVSLYIKFNKLEEQFVIVVSFHKQKHPIKYYFIDQDKQKEQV